MFEQVKQRLWATSKKWQMSVWSFDIDDVSIRGNSWIVLLHWWIIFLWNHVSISVGSLKEILQLRNSDRKIRCLLSNSWHARKIFGSSNTQKHPFTFSFNILGKWKMRSSKEALLWKVLAFQIYVWKPRLFQGCFIFNKGCVVVNYLQWPLWAHCQCWFFNIWVNKGIDEHAKTVCLIVDIPFAPCQ